MGPAYITRTAVFLPGAPVSNEEMEGVLGQVGARPSRARRMVLRSNQIRSRHYAIDPAAGAFTHTNAQLTAEAVRALNEDLGGVDLLACGTSIPDQIMPNHAAMVQGELRAGPLEAVATSGVCLSGVAAAKYAFAAIASGLSRRAIATGSELASAALTARNFAPELESRVAALEANPEIAFEKDFLRWMLSDGAGAFLIEPAPRAQALNLRIDWIETLSYAGEMETCMYCGGVKTETGALRGWTSMSAAERDADSVMSIKQDVKLLNENVIAYTLEKPLRRVAEKHGLSANAVDYFLPHYSSDYFRDRVSAGLANAAFEIPQSRWFTNLYEKGNTGAASIYIILDELVRSGRLSGGEKLLCWVPESGRFSGGFMHLTVV